MVCSVTGGKGGNGSVRQRARPLTRYHNCYQPDLAHRFPVSRGQREGARRGGKEFDHTLGYPGEGPPRKSDKRKHGKGHHGNGVEEGEGGRLASNGRSHPSWTHLGGPYR